MRHELSGRRGKVEVKSKAGVGRGSNQQTWAVDPFSVRNQSRYVYLRISGRYLCKKGNVCSSCVNRTVKCG